DRPRGQRPQGRADDRPDGDRGGVSPADQPGATAGPAPRGPRPLGQFPLHDQRQGPLGDDARGLRPVDGPLHRARAQPPHLPAPPLSTIYSGTGAAIGTLKGPLHGGANEEAWKVLEIVGSPEKAGSWIQEALARKERIMGFGHRVYKTGDPRAAILKPHCVALA